MKVLYCIYFMYITSHPHLHGLSFQIMQLTLQTIKMQTKSHAVVSAFLTTKQDIRSNLTNSGLKGTLHDFPFSFLLSLANVDLSMNELFGTIPFQISHLSKLIYLDLSFNNLSMEIPPQIGLLTNHQVLHLGENRLNDSIPIEIGHL